MSFSARNTCVSAFIAGMVCACTAAPSSPVAKEAAKLEPVQPTTALIRTSARAVGDQAHAQDSTPSRDAPAAAASTAPGFYFERHIVSPVVVDYWPLQVVVADVTGDRREDVVLAANMGYSGILSIHAQTAEGTLAPPIEFRIPTTADYGGRAGAVAVADLQGDGLPEIILAIEDGMAVFQKTDAGFSRRIFGGKGASALGALDVDGDGRLDVFAQGDGAELYLGDGRGGFRDVQPMSTPLAGYNTLEISDYTGDGIADVVMTNGQGWPKVFVYPGILYGGLRSLVEIQLPAVQTWPPYGMTVADMDRDGRPDLVVSDTGSALTPVRGIHIYYAGAGTSFARHTFLAFDGYYQRPGAVQVGDIDGNGYPDIVAMMNSNNEMGYILQSATGFAAPVFHNTGDNPWTNNFYLENSFALADINSDGCLDVVLAEASSSLRVFHGRNCTRPQRQTGGTLPPRSR